MRVLALYDLHGNPFALDAVLTSAPDVDAVVVGGDAVPGAHCSDVLDRLQSIDVPVHWLRGNGEREVAAELDADDQPADDDIVRVTAAASARELGAGRARPLGDLPLTLELDGVLYCHATPRADDEMATRSSSPEHWATVLHGVTSRLVVAGHTHQQDDRMVGDVRFVNAGSVGMPYEGDGAARWLLVVDGEPSLRSTAYDHVAAGKAILASGWPDARSITASLIDPLDPLEITRLFEARVSADAG